jgi:oxepin-CoA hydrolase/3-oxo-5,6-dehydrosuberyl-CoA semialdehyde dehydrogenase
MVIIPFDVNDDLQRQAFFDHVFITCIAVLAEEAQSLWGRMTAQNMIEHLLWAFECSTGTIEVTCCTPVTLLERTKRFLYDNRPTPREFKNPLLGEGPLPYRYQTFADAKNALQREAVHFVAYFIERPDAVHIHPIFGPLGAAEWQRSHFKHCYHHLVQFALIDPH